MTITLPAGTLTSQPAGPEVLVVGARTAQGGFFEALNSAGIANASFSGAAQLSAALGRFRPLLIAVGDELPFSELIDVGKVAKASSIPVVLLSCATPGPEQIEEWSRAGVSDCLRLPFEAPQLVQRLSNLRRPAVELLSRPRSSRTVLLAGEPTFCARLADVLAHNGYQVDVVRDAHELAVQPRGPVQLLLLVDDLLRPGATSALGALRRLLVGPGREVTVLVADASTPANKPVETPTHGFSVISQHAAPDQIVRKVDELLSRVPNDLHAQTRVPFFCPVRFREAGAGPNAVAPWFSGFSFDASVGGLFIKTLVPLRPGAPVEIDVHLATGDQLELTGVVAWANAFTNRRSFSCPVGMGVQFLALPPRLRRLLEASALARGAAQ